MLSKHTDLIERGAWSFAVTNVLIALVATAWFARGSGKETSLTEEDQSVLQVTEEALIEIEDNR